MTKVPMQKPRANDVDELIAREAYKEYAAQGHGSQSFERLHERGGFCAMEIILLLYQRIQRIEEARQK
ncbi:hypothetical protein [Rouxiella badensis]|uniref:hypothetical protein n=1 Tax=Rouxiella badensis TaxID=1646377 RepID=UPI0022AB2A1C|nr:hypothetical protein [Rouxiella badensis]WAT10134.1 hypothetical protein O1V65_06105 [Rouxiella badensis]